MNARDPSAPRTTPSTCCYCGVGCGVLIESQGDRITGVRGDPAHPANFGRLCSKGTNLHRTATRAVTDQVRLLQPMRRPARGQAAEPVSWDGAMEFAQQRLLEIVRREGPDAVGFYVSGQFLTEEYYVFNKLAKGLLGTNNIDSNSRLCMSSAVAGYKRTLGADAPPCCYEDIDHAGTLFVAGANPAFAHPVLFRRIEDAWRARPGLRLIVVDPRRTATAEGADLHLAIAPGTDVALFHGMLHVLAWDGMLDTHFIAEHTRGFEALRERIREFTPGTAARICGVAEKDIVRAAHWFAQGPALSLYCQGLNQSAAGTDKNVALINLHLATGQIGRPGAGPFSLTGQPNAMGGREVGAMANLSSAHRDLGNAQDRREVARLWGVDEVPAQPGLCAVEMFEAAAAGKIKALWIACTNPAQSLPDQASVRKALERAEFVVVQEAFSTSATSEFADLLLPASSWGEKEGTVSNSERRISRVRAAVSAPGSARPDWQIGVDLARRLETHLRPGRVTLFPYACAEDVWKEHRASTAGRDLDIGAIDYAMLEDSGPKQWPYPRGASADTPRLYADAIFATDDGRARFGDVRFTPSAEARSAHFPFSLLTGRLRDQWHGMSRSGTFGASFGHVAEPALEMHAQDMARLGLGEGDLVRVASRHGAIVLPAQSSADLAPMQAFLAMHWGGEFLGGGAAAGTSASGVNALTTPARCATSMQPELKHAAVSIRRIELPWGLLAMAWLPEDRVLRVREALRAVMGEFDYSACVPFGGARQGVMLRASGSTPLAPGRLDEVERLLGLDSAEALRFDDPGRARRRTLRIDAREDEEELGGFLLAGDTTSESWMKNLLLQSSPVRSLRRMLLRPGARPPVPMAQASRQVCSCFGVTASQIETAIGRDPGPPERILATLQENLKCGTNCGSCLPEIHALLRAGCKAQVVEA